jgi:prophage regulatory protein
MVGCRSVSDARTRLRFYNWQLDKVPETLSTSFPALTYHQQSAVAYLLEEHSRVTGLVEQQQSAVAFLVEENSRLKKLVEHVPARLLRLPEVRAITGLSRTSIYEEIRKNHFPAPVPLTTRSVGWVEWEVRQWVEKHIGLRTDRGK